MSYNMMIGYDIYDCFTMEHFRLHQRMTLTTKIFCSPLYVRNPLQLRIPRSNYSLNLMGSMHKNKHLLILYRLSQKWRTNYLLPYPGCLNVHEKNMEKNFQTKKYIIIIFIINGNTM
jgi:hypothetical protein